MYHNPNRDTIPCLVFLMVTRLINVDVDIEGVVRTDDIDASKRSNHIACHLQMRRTYAIILALVADHIDRETTIYVASIRPAVRANQRGSKKHHPSLMDSFFPPVM